MRIHRGSAAVEFLDIGVVGGILQHSGDDAALAGHAHAALGAEFLQRFSVVLGHIEYPVWNCAVANEDRDA